MVKIYDFYLEPLNERYTEQWSRWFPEEFKKAGFEYERVEGMPLTSVIIKGAFLDVNSTIHWKATQISNIALKFFGNEIKDGDIFFVPDMWFPIEMLGYLANLNKVRVKIFAFLHAGSYTFEDFAIPMSEWAKYQEVAWAKLVDKIFVGTKYHKESFMQRRVVPYMTKPDAFDVYQKIVVTGNPFSTKEIFDLVGEMPDKEKIILFPNRFDYEKRPNIFLDIAQIIKKKYPDWKIIVSTSRPTFRSCHPWLEKYAKTLEEQGVIEIRAGISKADYYKLLAKSRITISTTIEENFGYCIVEALSLNTIPLCPNDYSHPELLKGREEYLYSDYDDLLAKIERIMNEEHPDNKIGERLLPTLPMLAEKYNYSIQRMIEEMNK